MRKGNVCGTVSHLDEMSYKREVGVGGFAQFRG